MGIFLCIGLLALCGVAAAWAGAVYDGNTGGQELWQGSLVHGTEWAGLLTGVLLLVLFGLTWRQVDGWGDLLVAIDASEETNGLVEREEATVAVGHLSRNRSFLTLLIICSVVVSVSTVACSVGQVALYSSLPGNVIVEQAALSGGESVATVILSVISLIGAIQIRQRCNELLVVEPEPS